MTDFPIIKSVGTTGGLNIFNKEYIPSNTPNYNVILKTFFTIPYKIDSIDTLNDIIVIGISEIQSVYVYKIIDTVVNIIKIITPQNSNILGTVKFGSCVKINQTGIFVSDPYYKTYGEVFLFYSTSIENRWNTSSVTIRPFDYKHIDYNSMFGIDFSVKNSTLYVAAPGYKDPSSGNVIGKCYYYSIDYNTKYISNVMISSNEDNSEGFGNNVSLLTSTYGIVSSLNSPVTNGTTSDKAGVVYIYSSDQQNYTNIIRSPDILPNANFGYSISTSGTYLLISQPNIGIKEGEIFLYKGGLSSWNYIGVFNIESLGIDTYSIDKIEGSLVFCINSLFLWTYDNNVYASEISEAGNIIPSNKNKLSNSDYSEYGLNIINIGNGELIITGYDSVSNKTIFDIYSINYV